MVISFLKHTNFYSFHYNYFLYWIDAAKILIYIWFKSLIRFIFYFQRSFKRLPVVFKSFRNRLIVGNRMFGERWCLNCCNENIKKEQQKIAKLLQIENWVLDLLWVDTKFVFIGCWLGEPHQQGNTGIVSVSTCKFISLFNTDDNMYHHSKIIIEMGHFSIRPKVVLGNCI